MEAGEKEFFAVGDGVAENGGDTFYADRAKTIANRKGKQSVKISIPMAK